MPTHVLKLERAEEHLAALDYEAGRYLLREPAIVDVARQTDTMYVARFRVLRDPPDELAVLIGDCVDNLRAALDHLIYRLTVKHTGSELPRTAWPVSFKLDDFVRRDRKGQPAPDSGLFKVRGIDPAAQQLVLRLQPFHAKDGPTRDALWQLDQMCNIDKHREVHLTVVTPETVMYTLRPPAVFNDARREGVGVGPFRDGAVIGIYHVQAMAPGTDVRVDAELRCQLVFDERKLDHGGQLTGPVIDTLRTMCGYVRNYVFPRFQRFE